MKLLIQPAAIRFFMLVSALTVLSRSRSATAFLPSSSCTTISRRITWKQQSPLLTTRSIQTHLFSSTSTNTKYSQSTQRRVEGLSAADEFDKLSTKMQLTPEELVDVLNKKLAASTTPASVEKAEYVGWLLSGAKKGKVVASAHLSASGSRPKIEKSRIADRSTSSPKQQNANGKSADHQTFVTDVLFAEREGLHPNTKRAVKQMGLTAMTEIQEKTFTPASLGRDVLGRARTGTGKTVAFLLPAIERILQLCIDPGRQIGILVVSPTRELATQIGQEAEKLIAFHRDMSVQVMYGGTNMNRDVTRLTKKAPTILVATPGRLLDHLQSTRIGRQQFGKDIMSQTPIVVLDETDRLLDMGFRREISKILDYLPRAQERQTLLFSATIPPDLKVIMAQNMNKDYVEVDCMNDGDAATQTNAQVQQSHLIVPSNSDGGVVSSVVQVLRHAVNTYDSEENPAKIVVFFPTARLVNFYAEMFNQGRILPGMSVLELHSKKTQSYRNRVSEEFRKSKRGVLFTSDVSARGVDYPNVSHVIQFGIPESREQYIHRLGRTGRGGTDGKGWLVLCDWESHFLQELKGVNIPVDEDLRDLIASPTDPDAEKALQRVRRRIANDDQVLSKSAKGAYQAFLGYYIGQMKRMRMKQKQQVVEIANDFAELSGLKEPPALSKQLVGKMGLKGISGLNVSAGQDRENGGRSSIYQDRGRNVGRRSSGRGGGGRSSGRGGGGRSSGRGGGGRGGGGQQGRYR